MERTGTYFRRIGALLFVAAGAMLLGVTGCTGARVTDVGPGVIFNNVIAGDLGGELKIAFPDYSRAPVTEQPKEASETFMIQLRPVWSPDGQKLAFTRTNAKQQDVLFVRTSLGHAEAPSKEIGIAVGRPVWSPTSDKVAFLALPKPTQGAGGEKSAGEAKAAEGEKATGQGEGSGVDEPVGLTVVDDDGTNERVIMKGEAEPVAWSDDGIYFTWGIYGMRDLRVVSAEGKDAGLVYRPQDAGTFVGEAALSPDGGRMAISVVSPDESSVLVVKNLTKKTLATIGKFGRISDLTWSPNGRSVTFVQSELAADGSWVMIASPDGRGSRLTPHAGKYRSPTFSSDSKMVAFVQDGDIFVQTIGGGPAKRITKTGDAGDIAWSPK